ncbi:histidyl-tRNA synthetase 2 [Anaeromyxobacter dehalogenans 2CP-1]|uniref:ATP phosphoribosyltransferase regulatory subunit n=1 Tax=Anaeromyxobacter dehalogenans (strain ATCC BAA-258 / DSM 21875 / 2CP-1) TaxID=455488 RepID=HISZ_ANAD2|nr:ATP phosphoribosyltransferase regulatory subunit [Anaeromyxobacter dehalogenans]B8JDI0.1 RecName: Full=ATP phosphoribosyltransferase regulatory subunit [Anaeromyxobacter dehalogenans 2CP-1]ACL66029.1 histidyl-tRNA synthetase 2 [Anaeromyxobacter dehalogenans 2CP-1]
MLDLSLPSGLRDLLPDHSAHLAELSSKLHDVFSRFGYRRVFLPTLERLDVVERGLSPAALADVMKFVEPGSGEVVAIRPDITPQIARLYAARPDALPSPARLCYDGPVLRAREARAGRPREVYQAGVELLGAGGASADAEALVLLARSLERVGLKAPRVEVGHARFAEAVMEAARLPERLRSAAWEALSRKDRAALAAAAAKGRGSAEAREAVPQLAGLFGDGALDRARAIARAVPEAAASLAETEAALRIARRRGVREVAVDLGEARGLGYYTGITFAGYAPGAGAAVARGGRYDGLLARFGRPGPAIGFAVDLEFATQALERVNGRGRGVRPRRASARGGRARARPR